MRKHYLWFFLWLLALVACRKDDSATPAAPCAPPKPADAYTFPILPGTPAWAAFTSGQQMVDACQVPANTLQNMSTVGLVYTCLDYPLLNNMTAHNSLQKGVRAQLVNFNGFSELSQRPDGAALLLARYQQLKPTCILNLKDEIARGDYSFALTEQEMVMAQDEYLAQLSSAQRHALLQEALTKYAEKKSLGKDTYFIFDWKTTAFVMARVMQAEQYQPFLSAVNADDYLRVFTTDVELQGRPQTLDVVIKYAEDFK